MAALTPSIGLAFAGGILTVLSPCVLPILPIVVGRSLQSHRLGPVALVAGLVGGFAVAGSLLGITASWLTGLTNGLRMFAVAVLLILGLFTLVPAWSYRLFSALPMAHWGESKRVGLTGEFWLGTQLGLLWTPCAGPVLGAILVIAATSSQIAGAFGLLLAYGVGAAFPLLAIAYGGRRLGQSFLRLRPHSALLQKIGGGMIIVAAISILFGWDIEIQLWLAPFFPRLGL
jgi:cytochrome c biogenesis protein CcdA